MFILTSKFMSNCFQLVHIRIVHTFTEQAPAKAGIQSFMTDNRIISGRFRDYDYV